MANKFPFEIKPLIGEEKEKIEADFLGYQENGLGRTSPGVGWVLGGRYVEDGHGEAIYGLELRDNDVWVASYPKTGRIAT